MSEEKCVELSKIILDKSLRENKVTHRTELFIISLKSLLPSEDEEAVRINYDRYNREFLLWKYYRESSNEVLDNILFRFDESIYWKKHDDSIVYRAIPIVFTNKNYDSLYKEVVKNVLYTTGNLNTIIETILIAKMIYLLLNKYENITELLKEEVINLNQKEFLEDFSNFFRVDLENYDGVFQIDFEKAKILGLNILNGIESPMMKDFSRLYSIYDEEKEKLLVLESMIKNIDEEDYMETDIEYFNDLGKYLYNIRKSRINPKSLIINDYKMPDVFEYKKGEWFDHSLLNKCQVIDKKVIDDLLYVKLKTKSGIYNFRKPI